MLASSARPSEPPRMSVVGRQAILDGSKNVRAYELLYRSSEQAVAAVIRDDFAATATVMLNAVLEIGLDTVAGEHDIFLNCSAPVLALPLDELLPASRVVLEILETVQVTDEVIERVQELRGLGFRVALDDYVRYDARQPLLAAVDLVKVDLTQVPLVELEGLKRELSEFRGQLLAEKVETLEDFERCQALGFDLFQGYFFCRPNVVAQRGTTPERQQLLEILATVQRTDVTLDEALQVIQGNLTVSYRLLRGLNSVVFALRQPVDSLRQALVLLGMPRVRAWVSLMAMSSVKDKSSELFRVAMVRASMCQELSREYPGTDRESMFTIGLLSLLDSVLDTEMSKIVPELPLGPTVRDALLGAETPSRGLLDAVIAYEHGHFVDPAIHGINMDSMSAAWLTAVAWTEKLSSALEGL